MKLKTLLFAMSMTLAASLQGTFAGDEKPIHSEYVQVQFLWLLDGQRNIRECDIPATDRGTTVASCHTHEILDLRSRRILGKAVDATADVDVVGGGLVGTGTTFFNLPQGNLTIRGRGTIQPVLEGNPTWNDAPVTHIAGIFPEPGADDVIEGDGIFKDAIGDFGLLGALDLTDSAENRSQFFCVYFINLWLKKDAIRECARSGFDVRSLLNSTAKSNHWRRWLR